MKNKLRTIHVPQVTGGGDTSYTVRLDFWEAVEAGASLLKAVRVGRYYYYHAKETDEIYRLTAMELAELGAGELDERGADYSLWCSQTGKLVSVPTLAIRNAFSLFN